MRNVIPSHLCEGIVFYLLFFYNINVSEYSESVAGLKGGILIEKEIIK